MTAKDDDPPLSDVQRTVLEQAWPDVEALIRKAPLDVRAPYKLIRQQEDPAIRDHLFRRSASLVLELTRGPDAQETSSRDHSAPVSETTPQDDELPGLSPEQQTILDRAWPELEAQIRRDPHDRDSRFGLIRKQQDMEVRAHLHMRTASLLGELAQQLDAQEASPRGRGTPVSETTPEDDELPPLSPAQQTILDRVWPDVEAQIKRDPRDTEVWYKLVRVQDADIRRHLYNRSAVLLEELAPRAADEEKTQDPQGQRRPDPGSRVRHRHEGSDSHSHIRRR